MSFSAAESLWSLIIYGFGFGVLWGAPSLRPLYGGSRKFPDEGSSKRFQQKVEGPSERPHQKLSNSGKKRSSRWVPVKCSSKLEGFSEWFWDESEKFQMQVPVAEKTRWTAVVGVNFSLELFSDSDGQLRRGKKLSWSDFPSLKPTQIKTILCWLQDLNTKDQRGHCCRGVVLWEEHLTGRLHDIGLCISNWLLAFRAVLPNSASDDFSFYDSNLVTSVSGARAHWNWWQLSNWRAHWSGWAHWNWWQRRPCGVFLTQLGKFQSVFHDQQAAAATFSHIGLPLQ